MNYVLLDTSVLVNCALVNAAGANPELLTTISGKMREKGLKLLLPAAIELEFARKIPEELELIKQQTKKFRDAITTQVLPAPDVSRLHETLDQLDAQRDAAADKAREYFADLAADVDLTVHIPLDGAIIAEAIGYALEGRKPSRGPSRGLLDPDSLIVASVANFARIQGLSSEDVILICSDNHTDFGAWDPETKIHIVAPDIAEVIPCAVRYYKSPRTLVERELQVDVEADAPLAHALDEYDDYIETIATVAATSQLSRLLDSSILAMHPEFLKGLSANLGTGINPELLKGLAANLGTGINPELLKGLAAKLGTGIDPEVLKGLSTRWQIGIKPSDEPTMPCDADDDESENKGDEAAGD